MENPNLDKLRDIRHSTFLKATSRAGASMRTLSSEHGRAFAGAEATRLCDRAVVVVLGVSMAMSFFDLGYLPLMLIGIGLAMCYASARLAAIESVTCTPHIDQSWLGRSCGTVSENAKFEPIETRPSKWEDCFFEAEPDAPDSSEADVSEKH